MHSYNVYTLFTAVITKLHSTCRARCSYIMEYTEQVQQGASEANIVVARTMLQCTIIEHSHLLYPVQACDLINQLAKKFVSLLTNYQTA